MESPLEATRAVYLPRPLAVTLRHFTLYGRHEEIRAEFDRRVVCLAGANGLGKSTFLAAVNFAITGRAAGMARRFIGPEDYYKDSRSYSQTYFEGRIAEADHERAEVELDMLVSDRRYSLIRGMFDPAALRSFRITTADGTATIADFTDLTDDDRHTQYVRSIVNDSGFDSFAHLTFLQLFVLTFDERRRLLFWEDDLAQTALFIAFGVSPGQAHQAEQLHRRVERTDSLVRNLQWQATGLRRDLNALQSVTANGGQQDTDVKEEYDRLQESIEQAAQDFDRRQSSWLSSQVKLADVSAQLRVAQAEYDSIYTNRLSSRHQVQAHPDVAETLAQHRCVVCGTEGQVVASTVRDRIAASRCPLCDSPLASPGGSDDEVALARLEAVGERIVSLETQMRQQEHAVNRLEGDTAEAERNLQGLRQKAEGFHKDNAVALAVGSAIPGAQVDEAIARLQGQIARLLQRKDAERQNRRRAQEELARLQMQLLEQYAAAEREFVPRFTELAREFLGMELEVYLERRGANLRLRLTLEEAHRNQADEMSESQRFFVDIALRMALAKQLSTVENPATLYLDTPEGSLDIAYEARAGAMFGRFVSDGSRLIMTANINTSQLLRRLAETSGREWMRLVRMTDWADLSEVQQEEEALFDSAYAQIESALDAGRPRP
jgi:ABC-type lipoprotein export system ATPase subunit